MTTNPPNTRILRQEMKNDAILDNIEMPADPIEFAELMDYCGAALFGEVPFFGPNDAPYGYTGKDLT